MAASTVLQTVTFRDAKGQTATFKYYVTSLTAAVANLATAATAINNALVALSNAAEQSARGPVNTGQLPLTYGASAAQYQDVPQKAVLTFASATGALHRYQVPSPKLVIFKADQQTVDPGQALLAAFKNAFVATYAAGDAFASSKDGNQIVSYIGGVYRASKGPRRRLGITVLDSSQTAGLPAI